MITRHALERAIQALEKQRAVLGNAVVDTAVTALREKLEMLQGGLADSYRLLTVLVADLSGFTAMSELLDAEQVRDMINAMWQRLDHVIHMWGGAIDKHLGDGVIALFGLSNNEDGAYERAVQAALDMQLELAVLNDRIQQLDHGQFGWRLDKYRLQMRIGVNAGPVYWGQVGSRDVYTAVGDTITIAEQLESLAPIGGTLISDPVYHQVRDLFDVQPLLPVSPTADEESLPVYLVQREQPTAFSLRTDGYKPDVRVIGRDVALMGLQQTVQTALEGGFSQLVIVKGHTGVGKSRLQRELRQLLQMGPGVTTWYGRVRPELTHLPYSLWRDMLAQQFRIRRWQDGHVAQEKLLRGLSLFVSPQQADQIARQLGPFLGLVDGRSAPSQEAGFAAMAALLTAMAQSQPTLLVLDDLQRADPGSLALIEYLVETCAQVPLVLMALTRSQPTQIPPEWPQISWPPEVHELSPLSSIDTHHLLHELLYDIPHISLSTLDMLVALTQGNPLFVIELVAYLTVQGVIERSEETVRVHQGRLQTLAVPSTLRGLFLRQFSEMSNQERMVLQMAAVMGPVFWDRPLQTFLTVDATPLLQSLVRQGVVHLRHGSYFTGLQEYEFHHDWWQQIAYESIPIAQRIDLHKQMANWLLTQAQGVFPGLSSFAVRQQALAQADS